MPVLFEAKPGRVRQRFYGVDTLHQGLLPADLDRADGQRQDRHQHQSLWHQAGREDNGIPYDFQEGVVNQETGDEDQRHKDEHNQDRDLDDDIDFYLGRRFDDLVLFGNGR